MKILSIALAVLGLLAAIALVAWFGAGEVAQATFAVGLGGFALLCGANFLLFMLLATSWNMIVPPRPGQSWHAKYGVYLWGRMVRDSAGNCLPFTQMGGFIAGARAVSLHGVSGTQATASTIADVTAEVLAQAIFAALGLVVLIAHAPRSDFAWPVAIGLAIALPALAAFMVAQRGAGKVFARLSRHIAGEWPASAQERAAVLAAEFSLIYGHTGRLIGCVAVHLLAWIGTGATGWIAFRLLGVDISLMDAIAVEALLHAVLAVSFLVPGHAGVQEAAYIGLGAVFGVPPEIALAASLLRRARELAWGIPVLLIWQGMEIRRLRSARARGPADDRSPDRTRAGARPEN